MGLFNRGHRSDQKTRPSTEREFELAEPHAEPEDAVLEDVATEQPAAEPAPAEPRAQEPAPAEEPEAIEPEAAQPDAEQPAEQPEAKADPEPIVPPEPDAAELRVTSEPEPSVKRVPERPPANTEDASDDDNRITARQALAPVRAANPEAPDAADDSAPQRRVEVISFANQKGGVAKTTTTLNLAVAFAESGHDVLCIDLDPQGNLTMSQGIDPDKVETSMFDVLVHHVPLVEAIQKREIDIAVASIDLAGAEIAMSTQIGRERSLEKAIKAVENDYDFICIDTPPSLGLLTVNALTASDKVIVPVQCEYLSMRGLLQLQNTLEMIKENLNPRVRIEGILPTMLDARTVHAKEAVEILEENFGDMVFETRIRKAIKFAEAPVRGSSVLKYDPNGNAAGYYRELAQEVLTNGAS